MKKEKPSNRIKWLVIRYYHEWNLYQRGYSAFFYSVAILHGYSFEQVTQLFSSIVKRVALAKCFLEEMKIIYKGG